MNSIAQYLHVKAMRYALLSETRAIRVMRPVLSALVLAGVFSHYPSLAGDLEVTGEARYQYFKAGKVEFEEESEFTVRTHGCESQVVVVNTNVADRLHSFYCEYGVMDGTNSYVLSILTNVHKLPFVSRRVKGKGWVKEEIKPSDAGAPSNTLQNAANLTIVPTVVPCASSGLIAPLWLAYGSQCYFKNEKAGEAESTTFIGYGLNQLRFKVKADWSFHPSSPVFLEHLTYYCDGKRYTAETGVVSSRALPKPFDVQTTNSTFRVVGWTNVAGLMIPSEFLMYEFQPRHGGQSKDDLSIVSQFHATARTVRLTSGSPLAPPNIPPKTWVSERRLALDALPVPESQYLSTNGAILPLARVKESKNHIANARHLEARRSKEESRVWFMVLLAAIVISPIAVVLHKRRTRRTLGEETPT